MNVLVTGASGFLGRHVCAALEKAGLVVRTTRGSDAANLAMRRGYNHLRSKLDRTLEVDCVIHLAANCGGIGWNEQQPFDLFTDNMQMGMHVIEACIATETRLVMVGTCCSYPRVPKTIPFVEEELWGGYPEGTNAAYGVAKRALLSALRAAEAQYGLRWAYPILANLYGPGEEFSDKSHVIPALIHKLSESHRTGEPAKLWGTGRPTRDWLHVRDAAEAIVQFATRDDLYLCAPVNIGTGLETPIVNVCEYLREIHYPKASWTFDSSKPDGQPRRVLCSDRAREWLEWIPKMVLTDGLDELVKLKEQECASQQ